MAFPTKCLKYLVLVFSVIFVIAALVSLVFSAINLVILLEYRRFLESNVPAPGAIVVASALLSCLLVWLSWRGTTQEKRCLLNTFGFLLVLMVIVQITAAVWVLLLRADVGTHASEPMTESLKRYKIDDTTTSSWDKMQKELECCGVGGPSDFRSSGTVPWTCCGSDVPIHGDCQYMFQRGCVEPMTDTVNKALLHIALIAFCASFLQAVGVLCSCYLSNSIGNDRRRERGKH